MKPYFLHCLLLVSAVPTDAMESTPVPTLAPVAEAVAAQASSPVNWSLIIALAALALSVLSPIFSAWISGRYQLKLKRLELKNEAERRRQEFYDAHRAEVIENFITTAGAAIQDQTFQTMNAFGRSAGEIYLYLPEKLWPLVEAVSEDLAASETKGAAESLTILCKKLSAENVRPHDQAEPKRVDKK